jgi:hypothetical protein
MLVLSVAHCSRDASAQVARTPRAVVVSLYTSEGCSSCPAADAVLTGLGGAPRDDGITVVPLSFHVDYWNYIGWADPYSTAENSRRQQLQARSLGSRVYTPQAFIDGRTEVVGSDRGALLNQIALAGRTPKSEVTIMLDVTGKTLVARVTSPALVPGTRLAVALTQARAEVPVTRGENAGSRLVHTNVVRAFETAAGTSEHAASVKLTIPESMPREGAKIVAFVEDEGAHVLGVEVKPL